jgi:hypothetical protein
MCHVLRQFTYNDKLVFVPISERNIMTPRMVDVPPVFLCRCGGVAAKALP